MSSHAPMRVALVPPHVSSLPEPWRWWYTRWRATPTSVTPARSVTPGDWQVIGQTWRMRGRTQREIYADRDAAVAAWRAGRADAQELMLVLPDRVRRWALAMVGYSAHGHQELFGLGVDVALVGEGMRAPDPEPDTWSGTEPADPGPDRHGRTWERRVLTVPPDAIRYGDGLWYLPQDVQDLAYTPHGWVRPRGRVARAIAGTPLPDGWQEITSDQAVASGLGLMLALHAPDGMTPAEAMQCQESVGRTDMTTVVVSPVPDERGRYEAWCGLGGMAQSVGRRATKDDARDSALRRIAERRSRLGWLVDVLGPWPEMRVIEAPSPGWVAVTADERTSR